MQIRPTASFVVALAASSLLTPALTAQARRPQQTRSIPLEVVCGPSATLVTPSQALTISGGTEPAKRLFGVGETVLINAGTSKGLRAGQQFFVRRIIEDRFAVRTAEARPQSVHTAGWITIVETQTDVAVATIEEACDGVQEGDYLEPFVLPVAAAEAAAGVPDFERPGQVILGDDRRQMGAAGSLMVIDRGTDHGLRVGQKLTFFRPAVEGVSPVVTVGDGVVVSVQSETALMRIEKSRDAIHVGDRVAIHR